jgi:predicted Zn-dependent protease
MNTIDRNVLGAAALAGAILALGGCATNPATGESQLSLIGEAQEIEIGRQAAAEVEASIGLVDDAGLQQYVNGIGQALAASSERPHLPWRFAVVDDPGVNAFALPGGFIYVTRGIMATFMSEAELAAVLGHEIGHVTARHSVNQMSQQQLFGGLAGLGAAVFDLGSLAQGVIGTGLGLLFLQYSRDDEREADDLGLRYMTREGFAPEEMLDVFATLERVGASSGGSAGPEWLLTHPTPANRFERIRERIAAEPSPVADPIVRRDQYLQQVDGLEYGPDPRDGFFRGTLFMHPDLAFLIEFPSGWRTQNLASAVLAMSPGEDALLQLTLATQGNASAALSEFGAQEGLQMGRPEEISVNGRRGRTAVFEAQTADGALRGVVAFVEYDGRVYQILGYTPADRFSTYDGAFERTIYSFDRLTDPEALRAQPQRVALVRTTGSMSVAQFASRYGNGTDAGTLALINGLDSGENMSAGTWKTIEGTAPFTAARP